MKNLNKTNIYANMIKFFILAFLFSPFINTAFAQATPPNCATDRAYGQYEYMRRHINGTVINCLNLFDVRNYSNSQAQACVPTICAGFKGPNPSDWIVIGPDQQLLDCRAGQYYREADGNLPSWWATSCASYTPGPLDNDPVVLDLYPISAYPPLNGNCSIEGWLILSKTTNAVPLSNEDASARSANIQDCRGMYYKFGGTRDRLRDGRVRTSSTEALDPDQKWFNAYTNTGKNGNTSCTTWDIAYDNCNPRTNTRYFEYDSSTPDFMTNWDQIVRDAAKNKTMSANRVLLLNNKTVNPKTGSAAVARPSSPQTNSTTGTTIRNGVIVIKPTSRHSSSESAPPSQQSSPSSLNKTEDIINLFK